MAEAGQGAGRAAVTRRLPWEPAARSGAGAETEAAARRPPPAARLPGARLPAPGSPRGAVGGAGLEEGRGMRPPSGDWPRAS